MARAIQLMLISVTALILGGCGKEEEIQVPAEDISRPFTESTPPPAAVATPAPATMATPPRQKRLLPDGEFVLVKRASVVTDSGIFGAGPGTKVKLVRKSGSKLIVTNGAAEFEVTENDLTNDLDVIESLNSQNLPPPALSAPTQTGTNARPAPAPAPIPPQPVATPDPRIAQRDRITAQIAALNHTIAGYNERLSYLNEQQYKGLKSSYGSARANALARDRNTPEESRINTLLKKAEAQREALREQLRSMR